MRAHPAVAIARMAPGSRLAAHRRTAQRAVDNHEHVVEEFGEYEVRHDDRDEAGDERIRCRLADTGGAASTGACGGSTSTGGACGSGATITSPAASSGSLGNSVSPGSSSSLRRPSITTAVASAVSGLLLLLGLLLAPASGTAATVHLTGPESALDRVARSTLGVGLDDVRAALD